jgi:hypothetical protein
MLASAHAVLYRRRGIAGRCPDVFWDSSLCAIFPFHRNKKGANRISGRAHCFYLYFHTSKSEGVNPPIFHIYISIRISGLEEIDRFYPLDKIFGEAGFQLFAASRVIGSRFLQLALHFSFPSEVEGRCVSALSDLGMYDAIR